MTNIHHIQDKLLPSIFDRLTDYAPRKRTESKSALIMNSKQYKASVLKDVMNILNTNATFTLDEQVNIPTNILNSTLNYGTPALSGTMISNVNWDEVETELRLALIRFEPRLDPKSIDVTIHFNDEYQISQNRLVIEIHGKLILNPYSNELWLRTSMDVETGHFQLIDGQTNE